MGGSSPEGVSGGKSEGTGYTATKTQSEERKGQSFSLVKASISIGVGSVSAGVSEGTSVSETID